jgi:hypothetical protein
MRSGLEHLQEQQLIDCELLDNFDPKLFGKQ